MSFLVRPPQEWLAAAAESGESVAPRTSKDPMEYFPSAWPRADCIYRRARECDPPKSRFGDFALRRAVFAFCQVMFFFLSFTSPCPLLPFASSPFTFLFPATSKAIDPFSEETSGRENIAAAPPPRSVLPLQGCLVDCLVVFCPAIRADRRRDAGHVPHVREVSAPVIVADALGAPL